MNDQQPFGPIDTESLVKADCADVDQLFDRSNLIYAQTSGPDRPAYIVGRKGAGKTAFLLGGLPHRPEVLRTSTIYSEMTATLRCYTEQRGPLFVDDVSEIWAALFDQVAIAYGCRTASLTDHSRLQVMWDYLDPRDGRVPDALPVAEQFLATLQRRIKDSSIIGFHEVVTGVRNGGVSFAEARAAARVVLTERAEKLTIVMDNLEDLHSRLHEVRDALAGLFTCVGNWMEELPQYRPYGLHICLPSELFASVQDVSANPEKDFRTNYLSIYWTARELLHLAGSRLRLFLATHHPEELAALHRRFPETRPGIRDAEIALLRKTLPEAVQGDLGMEEDPLAYMLRHTQLLPRHLLQILNRVYGSRWRHRDSTPWAVSPAAVVGGTRAAEELLVRGILAAHKEPYPRADEALGRLSERLGISFAASDLHQVFNREGIRKITGLEFGEFLSMLFKLGVLGILRDRTARYDRAEFQYTFDYALNPHEESSTLCLHPLFTRFLHERSLPRLRRERALPVYPYGSDPGDDDYRLSLGYVPASGR